MDSRGCVSLSLNGPMWIVHAAVVLALEPISRTNRLLIRSIYPILGTSSWAEEPGSAACGQDRRTALGVFGYSNLERSELDKSYGEDVR